VNEVRALVAAVRIRLLRERAAVWVARGLAVAGLAAVALELAVRRWPLDPVWPALLGCAALGATVAATGWSRAMPSLVRVARVADARLGGQERLVTALEFAGEGGWLYARQRQDAAAFALRADLGRLGPFPLPLRTLLLGGVAVVVAGMLALLPNPALRELELQRQVQAEQAQAAGQVAQLARQAQATTHPGETSAQHQALVHTLQQAAQAVRQASSPTSAVAALSKAQQQLSNLTDQSQPARQQAAQAAGQQLAHDASAAQAGKDLASGNLNQGAKALQHLASSLGSLSSQERQQLASSLSEAARAASGDQRLSQDLQRASQALQRGDSAAAQQALQQAAAQLQQTAGQGQFQGDLNQAINGLQQAKLPLEGQGQGGQGQRSSSHGQGSGAGHGRGSASGQGQGSSGSGSTGGAGSGGGHAGQNGVAAPSDQVFIPGQATSASQGVNQGASSGEQNGLVPYQQVIAQYQAQAVQDTQRENVPEQDQQLVQQYFSSLGSGQ
jgi:hypothetical protein